MKTELQQNEQLIKNGAANLQKGIETVGGKLYLTNQRIVFEAHKLNVQGGITEIELSDIQSSEKCWTKFLGIIPLMPNSLAVYTKSGKEYRFVLFGRGAWAAAIEARRSAMTGVASYLRAHATPVKASPPPQAHIAPPPLPPAPPERSALYLHLNGKVQGPFTTAQVEAFLQVGTATLDTLCCIHGSQDWVPLSSLAS